MNSESNDREELVSLEQAADQLSVSKSTLYRMIERGEVKGRKVGRQWRFRITDLKAYLERGPRAVALSSVSMEDIDDFLTRLADELARQGAVVPPLPHGVETNEKLAASLDRLFRLAIMARASDIHLTPEREDIKAQFRVDGVLHEALHIPHTLYAVMLGHLKQMCGANPDEHSVPQDMRVHTDIEGQQFDLRVNILPTVFGESAVFRILNQSSVVLGLHDLRLGEQNLTRLRRWCDTSSGLVICTGPTGSGKTTTLYSCLLEIAGDTKNTLTIEDPVEYLLPNTRQTQVNRRAGLTFATALRAFLRQDPDVIMVGEIRDLETAEIVVQAALTGHLLFTTLHANNTASAVQRLVDMGVELFLIDASLLGVITQRLARQLCPRCKEPISLPAEVLAHVRDLARQGGYDIPDDVIFTQGKGCEHCRGFGYRGRVAIYELMEFTPAVRKAFLRGASVEELTRAAVGDGMHTLFADGIRKAAEGITTVDEVLRVTMAH